MGQLKRKYLKPLDLRRHFKRRVWQRLGIKFNRAEFWEFKKAFKSGKIVLHQERQFKGIRHRSLFSVEYNNIVFDVVYDAATKEFVTCKYLTLEKFYKLFL